MTTVRFELHRVVGSDVQELGEDAIALCLSDPAFAQALAALDPLEGALVIEGDGAPRAAIVDDLASAVQRLCFEGAVVLLQPDATVAYRYFTAVEDAALVAAGDTITVRGGDVPTGAHPRPALVRALYQCGRRYLALVATLGEHGRAASAADLAQLQPFADRAGAALAQAGVLGPDPPG